MTANEALKRVQEIRVTQHAQFVDRVLPDIEKIIREAITQGKPSCRYWYPEEIKEDLSDYNNPKRARLYALRDKLLSFGYEVHAPLLGDYMTIVWEKIPEE